MPERGVAIPNEVNELVRLSKLLQVVRRVLFGWRGAKPHFSVSVRLREAPDLLCSLTVSNPGPPFKLRSARLLTPRQGLIYRREMFSSDQLESFGFRELQLDQEVGTGQTVEIPFEVWLPDVTRAKPLQLTVKTSRRMRNYRCRPASSTH